MIYAQMYNALVEINGRRFLVPAISWPFRAFSVPKADVMNRLKTFVWPSSMAFFVSWLPSQIWGFASQLSLSFLFFDHLFCLIASLLGDWPTDKDKFSSVTHSCLTLYKHMDCSMPGFPVHHQLLELAQTHVHQVGDAIQPSHPLSPPSPAFSLSQHQGLLQWVVLCIRWPKYWSLSFTSVLLMNIQDRFPLGLTEWISLQSKGLSRIFSNTTVQKHQFFGSQFSLGSNSHIQTWLLEKQ